MTLPVSFGLRVLKPNLVSNAHQVPERSNVDGRLAQQHLQLASGLLVGLVRSLKQSIHYVCHRFLHGEDSLAQAAEEITRREQFREAFIHLAVIAVAFPIFFTLADWWAL